MESSSNESKSQESYISNKDTLRSLKEIQKQIIVLKSLWKHCDMVGCKITPVCFIYLSLPIYSQIVTITTVECILVHSRIFLFYIPHIKKVLLAFEVV